MSARSAAAFSDFGVFAGARAGFRPGKPPPGYSSLGHIGHYDPNQPRVPAGNPDGGQWTSEGPGAEDEQARAREGADVHSIAKAVSDALEKWNLGAQYAANDNNVDPSHSGVGPNVRHRQGVEQAIKQYLLDGYSIARNSEVAVDVLGFNGPRVYDFVAQDPTNGRLIGVEVKTTLYDMIQLNAAQVAKDVMVMKFGGKIRQSNERVTGVGYTTYCWGCELVPDIRRPALHDALKRAGIPFTHGGRPGEVRP